MNTSLLLWSLLFSSVGIRFLHLRQEAEDVAQLDRGQGLMTYPYSASNTLLLVAIRVAVVALPCLSGFNGCGAVTGSLR